MNLDLKQNESFLSSPLALMPMDGLVDIKKIEKTVLLLDDPSFDEILDQISPLPKTSLFLGQAEDNMPILLDLGNPLPGPILVVGDAGAGKTNLLKVVARFVVSTHHPQEIQYGIITDHPDEWKDQDYFPHCVGLFSTKGKGAVDFIQALAIWTDMEKTNSQSVLLMIDGLGDLACQNSKVEQDIFRILLRGPAKHIWPIVTINPNQYGDASAWLKRFHTRVFGYTRYTNAIGDNDNLSADFATLSKGREFSVKVKSQWIKFRIPRI